MSGLQILLVKPRREQPLIFRTAGGAVEGSLFVNNDDTELVSCATPLCRVPPYCAVCLLQPGVEYELHPLLERFLNNASSGGEQKSGDTNPHSPRV